MAYDKDAAEEEALEMALTLIGDADEMVLSIKKILEEEQYNYLPTDKKLEVVAKLIDLFWQKRLAAQQTAQILQSFTD